MSGISFEDEYRWLEDDGSAETVRWQREQNERTSRYLERWPGTKVLGEAAKKYFAAMFVHAPTHRGDRWFRMDLAEGGQRLVCATGPLEPGRVIVDPALFAPEGEPASLDWFYPSPDGRFVAFGISVGGDEQSVLRVVETDTGAVLEEEIQFASIGTVAWLPDSSGFYYNAGHAPDWEDADKEIFFHLLGETARPAAEPLLVREAYCVFPQISGDGRYLVAVTGEMDPRADYLKRLPAGEWEPFLLDVQGRAFGVFTGDRYVAIVTEGAPRGRLVSVPVGSASDRRSWKTLVEESEEVLLSVELVGDRLVVCSLDDAHARLRLYTSGGELLDEIGLPGDGAVSAHLLLGNYHTMGQPSVVPGDDDFTFVFSSFTRSPALHRYRVSRRQLEELQPPAIVHSNVSVSAETATASDGTAVRYRLIRRSDLAPKPQPTLVYGYGGWNISFVPAYLGALMAFVDAGGVLAFAHLRGGGEFGSDFWTDGRLAVKQHTYDDLYAVAEHLLARGVTAVDRLGAIGLSNGGLLTGVAVTQRPDLFRAVCSMVPLYDMLRFTRDSYTASCVLEYGDPDREADAAVLAAYSPYHNVRADTRFPAVLIYSGQDDMRCPPWQSRKLTARLQAATASEHPILLRIGRHGGHLTVLDPAAVTEWLGFLMSELGVAMDAGKDSA